MSQRSAKISLCFSAVGHTYSHLFAPIFYIAALGLEGEFDLSHGDVITLVVAGNVLFGVAAPVAGWLGDRWSAVSMMALFFLGTGLAMISAGLADGPLGVAWAMAATGLFSSIYHPVGIAWLVRNAENRGTALGINGVFGGIGPGVAALLAGALIEIGGWRAAFAVPGAVIFATGLAFYYLVRRGDIVESTVDKRSDPPVSKRDTVKAFAVLAVTMLCTGIIYQATQPALPKLFSEQLGSLGSSTGILGLGTTVAIVYFSAGLLQIPAGWLADRYPLKWVYLGAFACQAPFLAAVGALSGLPLILVSLIMVSVNVGALPAENSLVAKYAPAQWRGLAFGLKFILAFGLSGLGAKLEGWLYDTTGGFHWLFAILTAVSVVAVCAALILPSDPKTAPQAAE